MIELAPYSEVAALAVFRQMDHHDLMESRLIRGTAAHYLQLFAEWHAAQAGLVLSMVVKDLGRGGAPFAVMALGNTGQSGVAQAALLARDHQRFRRPLARTGLEIRRRLPDFCAELGIHRIEARCWRDHPTAARFLRGCMFKHDCDMPGFGPRGAFTYSQFAWTHPDPDQTKGH